MADEKKFKLLHSALKALGIPSSAIEEITAWIMELRSATQAESRSIDYSAYHLRDDFLSAAEHEFFDALGSALDYEVVVCPKVSLGDLFYTKTGDYAQNLSARNRIERKHVDFLLCDPITMRPLSGVELDDKSHRREDRRERDRLVDGVFEAAGLPLQRIRVQRAYDADAIREQLGTLSMPADDSKSKGTLDEQRQVKEAPPAVCPKCAAVMVLRTAKRGGPDKQFWGCPESRRCRSVRQAELQ